jgi:hypothetical protein
MNMPLCVREGGREGERENIYGFLFHDQVELWAQLDDDVDWTLIVRQTYPHLFQVSLCVDADEKREKGIRREFSQQSHRLTNWL